jgi:hypothetical protein
MFLVHFGLTVWLLLVVPFHLQNTGMCLFLSPSTTVFHAFSIFELVLAEC